MKARHGTQNSVPAALYIVVDVILFCVGLTVVLLVPPLNDLALMWIPIALLVGVALSVPIAWAIWHFLRPTPVDPPAGPMLQPIRIRLPGRDPARERRAQRPMRPN